MAHTTDREQFEKAQAERAQAVERADALQRRGAGSEVSRHGAKYRGPMTTFAALGGTSKVPALHRLPPTTKVPAIAAVTTERPAVELFGRKRANHNGRRK